MGEEYGEDRPFLYFTSHTDPALAAAVSEGRKNEFIAGGDRGRAGPAGPGRRSSRSKLSHRRDGRHGALREHYRRLLALRKAHRAAIARAWPRVEREGTVFTLRRPGLVVRANLGPEPAGGLGPWGVAIEEGGGARAQSSEGGEGDLRAQAEASGDPPHAFETGPGEGLAPGK